MPSNDWLVHARRLVPTLTDHQIEQLARFRDRMLLANERTNLTAIRNSNEIDYRLLLESLRLAPFVLQASSDRDGTTRVVDIGSGAGIPGVPLAIVFPEMQFSLIDATSKKVQFIENAIRDLELTNATATFGRSEQLARDSLWRESHHIATARAVGSLATLLELTMPLLDAGGQAIFPKGRLDSTEMSMGMVAADLVGAHVIETVMLEAIEGCPDTQVVIADKIAPIADRYPRRPGLPSRDPLGG